VPAILKKRRRRWWIVFGSTLGLVFSTGPLLQFTFGVFIKPVAEAFRTDRGSVSVALLIALSLSGILTPVAGRLVDQFGLRRAGVPIILSFAASIALIGALSTSYRMFVFCYGLAGIFSAGQTPLIYAKAIASAFDSRRGLALGIAMAGVGLGTAIVPRFAQSLISTLGWRGAYVALGAATFLVAVPAVVFFVDQRQVPSSSAGTAVEAMGLTSIEALQSPIFWKMAAAFFAVAVATAGVMAHIVPMMTDRGIRSQTAALAISAGGVALIGGRLIAGFALDYLFAPYVAMLFFAMPLFGIAILLCASTVAPSILAATLVGIGLGAEVDLIAYLQSRYLGLRQFGQTYGYFLAIFLVGSGVGPFAMGLSYSHTGGYSAALIAFGVGLLSTCAGMLTFGRYRFASVATEH
jgi:predicted MFS family arabinose efflux permease